MCVRKAAYVVAVLALGVAMAVAISVGPVITPPGDVLAALGRLLVGDPAPADALITQIRLPRVLLAGLVGGALAISGTAMQAVFRNPLAEPGITGVGAGAAAVAVLVIVSGVSLAHPLLVPVGAFIGALAATAAVHTLARRGPRASTSILLVGVAINSFLGAVISAAIANAPDAENARSAIFWLNGDLGGRTMADVALVLAPVLVGSLGVAFHARELNLLGLGEATAQSAGMAVARVSHTVLAFAALATAGAVATTGVISFVGLVVPHLIRLLKGHNHTMLLPGSFLAGAVFLIAADTVARMVFTPVVLQTGTVTALVGAPFLLFLLTRRNVIR
ncbi:iron ABC transporter permease [Trueperella pecoris]|uniref:Iron ABC transporter permease n=1 Tax=Trueperella pecoris TaxID=2733571 RepID=A0A7M1R561_9ACTO|nr:iron ABC transporter permease [Trueperella pecoris]